MAGYMTMNPAMMYGQFNISAGGCYGPNMGNSCGNILGGQGGKTLIGALLGTLAGGMLMPGNPLGMLLGAGLGAFVGNQMGQHHQGGCCNQNYPNAGCYPPGGNNWFGGPQNGGWCPPQQGGWCPQPPYWGGGGPNWGGGGGNWGGGGNCCPGYQQPWGHQCGPQNHCHQGPGGNPGGQLCQEKDGKPIKYTTSGGYNVEVNGHDVKITDPNGHVLNSWGDPHEKLDGKHIKDWEGKQRSIILGDGTKITMSATGAQGVTTNTSIYDGNQNVQINNEGNHITHHSANPWDTWSREGRQYDGETAVFRPTWDGGAAYYNIYNQDQNLNITRNWDPLARVLGDGKVKDYYDDPRLGHT